MWRADEIVTSGRKLLARLSYYVEGDQHGNVLSDVLVQSR
jgi:hypothetical protein